MRKCVHSDLQKWSRWSVKVLWQKMSKMCFLHVKINTQIFTSIETCFLLSSFSFSDTSDHENDNVFWWMVHYDILAEHEFLLCLVHFENLISDENILWNRGKFPDELTIFISMIYFWEIDRTPLYVFRYIRNLIKIIYQIWWYSACAFLFLIVLLAAWLSRKNMVRSRILSSARQELNKNTYESYN